MTRRLCLLVPMFAFLASTAHAWPLGSFLYQHQPSLPGHNLGDIHPGYYGGANYREYYSFGRIDGFGPWLPAKSRKPMPPVPVVQPVTPRPARLTLIVPESAVVFLDGVRMKQGGSVRRFETPILEPGEQYEYEIKIVWVEDGNERAVVRDVPVRSGDRLRLEVVPPGSQAEGP